MPTIIIDASIIVISEKSRRSNKDFASGMKKLFVTLLVLAALVWLAWRLRRVAALRAQAQWLAGLAALQLATGLSNVVLGWPLVAAVLHTGGAAALVVVLTWALAASRAAVGQPEMSAPLRAPRVIA